MRTVQAAQTDEAPVPGNQEDLPEQRSRASSSNLPLPLSSLVGRREAMDRVRGLLATNRLVTLTGPGGVGKTRLALEAALVLLDDFEDGVWWVDLGPLGEAGLVAHTVAMALGLADDPARSRTASLNSYLQDKGLLLVLDNCEHLIDACAHLAGELLRHSRRVTILATSREPLGIDGETVWSVPPLSLPCLQERPLGEDLMESEAGQLFLERAQAIQPDLLLTEAVTQAVAEICCRLEGIPLAIELAAARVRVLSVPQIAAHLDDLFRLLSEGSRTAPPRHQTLEAAIEWSYHLLSRPEQRLFARLAVFAGFGLEAAEAVASDPAGPAPILRVEVLDLLSHLVVKSLVVRQEGEPVRYRMLETIRQYAWERLLASGEVEQIRRRHLAYYVDLAERAESELTGADQAEWLGLLAGEQDNLRAALAWSKESEEREAGLRLAAALAAFWLRAGLISEGTSWLARGLAACREVGPVRVQALYQAGWLAQQGGDYEQALAYGRQSLALSRHLRDQRAVARALSLLGWILHAQGDRVGAGPLLKEGLALARESGDERTVARALLFLADLRLRQGAEEEAAGLFQESLRLYYRMGDRWCMAWAFSGLGEVARLQGDHRQAVAYLQFSLVLYQEMNSLSEIPYPLEGLARAVADQGEFERAARLWGAADVTRDAAHARLQPSYKSDYVPTLEKVRAALGEKSFAVAWAKGRAMTLRQALALALAGDVASAVGPDRSSAGSVDPEAPASLLTRAQKHGLTSREREVLRLVAKGLTDAQVAGILVISPRTVGKHLQSVYGKLHLHSRSAATRWALEHGLG